MKASLALLGLSLALGTASCVTVYQLPANTSGLPGPNDSNVIIVMNEMRRISTMCEAFAVDNNVYPRGGGSGVLIAGEKLFPVAALESDLTPYRQPVSAIDPWGKPYLYWVDEKAQKFVLICGGSDGLIDPETVAASVTFIRGTTIFLQTVPSSCLDDDIVLTHDAFMRYPRVSAKPCRPQKVGGA